MQDPLDLDDWLDSLPRWARVLVILLTASFLWFMLYLILLAVL